MAGNDSVIEDCAISKRYDTNVFSTRCPQSRMIGIHNSYKGEIQMYNTHLFEEEEYIVCKSKMETQTFTLLMETCNNYKGEGIPFPLIGIVDVCENEESGKFWARITDFKSRYISYHSDYGNLYRVLAFTIFGYGNWSNNDRIRKGLRPIRFKQF